MPLKLPTLQIGSKIIGGTPLVKLLQVLIEKNITWKYHIQTIDKKPIQNIG